MSGLSGDWTFVGALPVQELGLRFANNAAITFLRAYLLVIVKSDKMSFECGAIVARLMCQMILQHEGASWKVNFEIYDQNIAPVPLQGVCKEGLAHVFVFSLRWRRQAKLWRGSAGQHRVFTH